MLLTHCREIIESTGVSTYSTFCVPPNNTIQQITGSLALYGEVVVAYVMNMVTLCIVNM